MAISSAVNALTVSRYTLWKEAYYGNGGFESGYYLTQHTRESNTKYDKRREIAYFLNYVAPTVNAHVDPIFRKTITRTQNESEIFATFLKDADANGTSFENFMKYAAVNAKLNGVTFIVVDNVSAQPPTLAGVLKDRALPYVYIVEPGAVIDYVVTPQGRLTYFSYLEPDPKVPFSYQIKIWTETEWKIDGGSSGSNSLGVVPVIVFKSRTVAPNDIMPPSEFSSIVKTNLSIYNKCSWLDEILLNQTFALLTFPSGDPKALVLGTNNALGYDGTTSKHPPAFIAPPADSAKTLMEEKAQLIQEIYRMANLSLVTGVKTEQSGKSKEWDNEAKSDVLSNFAGNVEAADMKVVSLVEKWSKDNFDYKCEYPRNFSIPDVANELDNALKAVTLEFGETFNAEVANKVIAVYLPKLDEDTKKKIIEELRRKAEDARNAETVSDYGMGDKNKNKTDNNDALDGSGDQIPPDPKKTPDQNIK